MASKKKSAARPLSSFDDLDAAGIGIGYRPMSLQEPAQVETVEKDAASSRGALRAVADVGLEAASGAAKGIKFMSDVFGASNPVSQGLQGVSDFAKELQSAQAKGEDQRIAQLMKEAEDKGVGEQVKAALRAAGEAPVRQAIGAIGTSVPMIAASMVPGLREASWGTRAAALGGMGGAQGVGVVKSQMYDSVYQRALEEGRSEQEARALADQAQAYSAENAGDIALGGALGAGAALTGFEPAAARAIGQTAAKGVQRGLMQSTLRGVAAEALPEAIQGGQEQVAGNRAQQRTGFDTPTFRGAIGSATLEGLLSAPGGAVGGMLDARGAKPAPKLLADQIRTAESVPESGPMTRAANQAIEAKAQQVELSAAAEGAALAGMEAQAQSDLQGLRDFAGVTPNVVAGMPTADQSPVAEPGAQPSAEFIDSPFADRILTVQEMLADPTTRDKVRERWGDEGLGNIAYYLGVANRGGMPEKTQENLLGMAERLLQEAVLRPIQPAPELGGQRPDPLLLGSQPQPEAPALGMDTTPSGRFTVDSQGNAVPESRAQRGDAQRRADEIDSLGRQTPRGQAQPAATMQGALGIGMDTAPTGRLLAGQDGVRPETRMDAINIGQADMQRQAEVAQRAEMGLTPDIEAVQQRNAMRPLDGDILNPSGKPFKTLMAAQRAAKKNPGQVVEVTGGFAVRPATMVAAQPEVANDGRGNQDAAGLAEALAVGNSEAGDRAATEPAAVAQGEMLDAIPGQPAGDQPAQSDAGQDQRVGREGYDTPIELDAAQLKTILEKTRGEPLATKPAKLEAWRNGTAKTDPNKYPVELAFTTDGRLDVNDGRHRIALAAERGEKVTAFIDGKDAQRAQELLANVQNPPQPTAAQTPADQAPEAARGDGATPAGVPDQGGAAAAVEAAGVGDAGKIAQAINASIAEHAVKGNRKRYAEKVAKGYMSQEDADKKAAADEKTWASQEISERTQKLAEAIAKKDPTVLVGAWAREGQGTYGNEGSMAAFERMAGIKLRRLNSAERAKAIFDWAGWTEEQVAADVAQRKQAKAERDAAYEAKRQTEEDDQITERAGREMIQIRDTNETQPIKDYIDGLIAKGFNKIHAGKTGAITKTYLINEKGSGYPLPKGVVRDYAETAARRAAQQPTPTAAPVDEAQPTQSAASSTITADDLSAAEKQAAQMISDRIDGMKAADVQRIAARYLPTVGVKAPMGKARIKAAMTDAAAMNLLGPAGELGIELSDSVKLALKAKMEGRVGEAAAPVAAAAPAPAQPEQQTADQQDDGDGWSSGFYGVAGTQKKYTFSGKPDGHWASVKNPVGQGYEIEYRLGDKVVSAEEVTGSLAAVKSQVSKRVAELDATQATHKDPGQPAETVTQPVIQAAMKKAARNEDTKPSEMRTWLLGEIDKALQQAPDLADYDATVKRVGEKDAVSMFTGGGLLGKNSKTGYVTFDVPGDGTFKVRNSVRGLLEFKRKVAASPGFKDRGQDRVRPEEADSVRRGSGGLMSAITNMIEEGDFEAARDYAEAVGVKLEDVKAPKDEKRAKEWKAFLTNGTLSSEVRTREFDAAIDRAMTAKAEAETAPQAASDSLNKPHTIDKKRVLTPSGAIAAGARNSGADSSIWYHQGDIKMLSMTASVKIDGQLSKGADEAKRIVKAVSTAQKAGWALRNYRAGTLGTVWTLEKGDQFLTRAGLENIDAEQIKDPQIPDYGPGWDNMVRGQKDLAKALFGWLSTLPPEQRENQATVSRKMADVLGGWAYIERDKLGLHVRYKPAEKPEGNRVSGAQWTHTIPIATDWSHALQIIAEMAEGSFDAQPAAEAATNAATSTTPATDAHNAVMSAVREGKATPEQFKDGFEAMVTGKAAIMAELDAKTKVQLLREGGPYMQMRYASEKKADVVEAVYRQMLGEYALGESVTFGMGKDSYQNAVRRLVDATDADKLARFVQEQKAAEQEAKARIAAKAAAIQNPQTLEDYREVVRSKVREGMTTKEAFLSLTPEQRIRFDTLAAESTRDEREARKRAMKTRVSAASQTTGGQVIATKHTRDGYDLFVVQLADRLSAEDYKTVLASAKKLGGWYSSFRGNGATPGFQFKDRASADAFLALAGGDKTAAQNQVEQRRDAFEDDRGQTAVERLRAMADKLEEQASEEEGRDRKANTARRARFASAALAAAAAEKAKANTMRNIAQAIEDGKAKFLDEVRTKSQVDMLTSIVETAKANELRAKYPSYADQEKRKGEPPTAETADFADFPSFSAFRSDLAILGRQLLEVDGAKKLGQRLMSVADDVTDAYLEFAKGNLSKVSHFGRGDALADFGNQQEAERAIKRSGLTGKAIVLQVKRGQNRVILSPSEAIGRGIWAGDGDKRITLTVDFGNELVEAIGRRGNKSNRLTVPWQFQNAYDRRKALSRIGIETASEFRSALREFIDLKEQATANRVRELELQMVGRQKDGLDFFPTAAEVADQMVEAADLSPDMAVLEPSAGMGHLADRIREAGAEPDVIELSPDRRELLEEKGYHLAEVDDFMAMEPRKFFTYGDVFRAPDGTEGIMRGVGHMGSQRVRLEDEAGNRLGLYDRSDLVGVRHRGTWSGYDRIIMNPPFSNRRDAEHVRHAYDLLKPGGRIVAIMGEGVFFGQDQKAVDFRDWLESVGGTSEKLPEGSFMDPSLPVNTSVNARMVVIDKPQLPGGGVQFSRAPRSPNGLTATETQSIADAITARWDNAPEVVVAADMSDTAIPQAVRDYDAEQRSLGAQGEPEGFWYGGKVYLVADAIRSPSDVMRVLFHEALGHYGLRGVFGKALDPILNQIAALRRADVQAKADEYGLDLESPKQRLQAAEEVLAVMAQTKPELGYVKRAIAAIRSWMRHTFPRLFGQMKLTDAEIIRDYILPARGWVERGPGGGPKGGLPAMSRSQEQASADETARFSRAAAAKAYVAPAMDRLNETFNHPGKLNWWHKTVGSMYNLAERMPAFKPVYDAAQSFINDVSFYAIEAADKAPKLLPRLEDWKDLAKSPITAQDNKAVAAPVFEGTLSWRRDESGKPVLVEDLAKRYASLTPEQKAQRLLRANAISENVLKMWQGMPKDQYESSVNTAFEGRMLKAGIVFTPDELKSIFKLNDAQVALYQEFRQSIDASLDNMGKSDLLRVAGKDAADLKDAVMSAPDVDAAAVLLRDHLLELAKENPDRSDALVTTASDMISRAEKVQRLKMEGYAPLSRFGQYTVDVVVDGERQYFSMFETARDANRMAAKLKMEYGAENVAQGTLSQREFEMLQGITPESLELFGNMLGLDSIGNEAQDQVFQEYLKRTKANRSAMKRLIHRKGIAGYSENVGRVLAAFVYSNARQTSAALHMGDLGEAVMAIPKGEGELKDAAVELARYVKEPREEAAKMRGWLFAQYLGGSIASAIVNFTQPLTTSAPYLSQFGGMGKSIKALYQAMADLKDKKFEAGLAESFRKRTEDGTLAPQGVHELMAQSRGEATLRTSDGTQMGDALAKGRNTLAKVMIGWGKLFGMAEQINRQSTYVAAYRMAVERGIADPDAFAKKAVDETQFVNNKANKMKFGRGAIGATLMTFKSYSLNWLELFHRLSTQNGREGKMAAAWMLGVLLLSAGASGLPFAEDAEDLADFLAQRLGYNWSSKKARQEFLEDLFGRDIAGFVENGVTGLPGAPIDVSGRLGMGNMIPGTGLFLSKKNHTSDFTEVLGPAGDLAKRTFQAGDLLLSGNVGQAALMIAPKAIGNLEKGVDMAATGMYRDARGYKVDDATTGEAIGKAIGFQPRSVAQIQEASGLNQRAKDFYRLKVEGINAKWAKAIFEKDSAAVEEVRAELKRWNRQNPDQRIQANIPAILRRAKEMRKSKADRIADTAPKAMRASMREEVRKMQEEMR